MMNRKTQAAGVLSVRAMLGLLVAAAFGLRLMIRLPRGESSFLENGYTFYLGLSTTFLRGGGFCSAPGEGCASRMPVYPLLISPFLSSGWIYPGLVVLQAAIGTAMVWVAWKLGLELFNARTGLLAAGMTAFSPYAVVHDTALQETVLVNAFLALGVALLIWASRVSSGRLFAAGGATLALAVLTSARIGFVLPIAIAWTTLCAGRSWKRRVRDAVLVALPIAVLVGGWMVRNWSLTGAPVLTTEAGSNLWFANSPWTFSHFPRGSIDRSSVEAIEHLTAQQVTALETAGSNEIAVSRLWATWAFEYVKTHPIETMQRALEKEPQVAITRNLV
ncbi:MAG: hypothetical protein HW392_1408, partial [Steroidobacteraceae bacterium]|nr:hypothetical protein [Steroidobacteraceae bacterium]